MKHIIRTLGSVGKFLRETRWLEVLTHSLAISGGAVPTVMASQVMDREAVYEQAKKHCEMVALKPHINCW